MTAIGGQIVMFDNGENQKAFLDKFKQAVTTDDCYTPDNIYECVADWVAKEYGVDKSSFVRPFCPDGDFEYFDYPEGCVVVDNPPFSIMKRICDFYMNRGIRFFIFAPALTLLKPRLDVCCIATGCGITYANGANVNTGFITNLEPGIVLRTAPDLQKALNAVNTANEKAGKADLPKYEYPDYVVTSALCNRWGKYGIEYKVRAEDCRFIRKLDAQDKDGKAIFGGGLLLSERAAAERAAAERAAAERAAAERAAAIKWELSEREKRIVQSLGKP